MSSFEAYRCEKRGSANISHSVRMNGHLQEIGGKRVFFAKNSSYIM